MRLLNQLSLKWRLRFLRYRLAHGRAWIAACGLIAVSIALAVATLARLYVAASQ